MIPDRKLAGLIYLQFLIFAFRYASIFVFLTEPNSQLNPTPFLVQIIRKANLVPMVACCQYTLETIFVFMTELNDPMSMLYKRKTCWSNLQYLVTRCHCVLADEFLIYQPGFTSIFQLMTSLITPVQVWSDNLALGSALISILMTSSSFGLNGLTRVPISPCPLSGTTEPDIRRISISHAISFLWPTRD